MRQIKFRGKDKTGGQWYDGYYAMLADTTYCFTEDYENARAAGKDPEHHYIIFDQMSDWGLPNSHYKVEVDPETVCEFTGAYDSNKVPIYERDIIKVTNTYNSLNAENWYLVQHKAQHGGFVLLQGELYSDIDGLSKYCKVEVVGNAVDNPELLGNIPHFTPEGFVDELEKEFNPTATPAAAETETAAAEKEADEWSLFGSCLG